MRTKHIHSSVLEYLITVTVTTENLYSGSLA